VGKTAVGIQLAERLGTEILSTDSRQFYREMQAATGKPTVEELARVPHHFIDNLSIFDAYSAGRYEAEAMALLETLFGRVPVVLAVGGSGLYFQALTTGLDAYPEVLPGMREQLMAELEIRGLPALLAELEAGDPQYYATVDRSNARRIVRALEVMRSSGQPFSGFQGQSRTPRPYRVVYLRLGMDRQTLYERIDRRVEGFVAMDLFGEAERLYPHRALPALQTPGYREAFDYLDGRMSREQAIEKILQHNRNYAKRQETWLRQQVGGQVFHPEDEGGILSFMATQLEGIQL
jgi:tRNA dimethylallyltransferase